MPNGRVTVQLEITAIIDCSDTGYLGLSETVQTHINKAKTDAQAWQFFIQRGGLEPELIRTRVKVLNVSIIPEESS